MVHTFHKENIVSTIVWSHVFKYVIYDESLS